jgi:acid-sensing ion channel, other
VRVCSSFELACIFESNSRFWELIAEQEKTDTLSCNCWPSCTSITYETEINHVEIDETKRARSVGDIRSTNLTFLFKQEQFYAYERTEQFGQTNFIANKGGLLGFFMGVSLLGVAEVVYSITIRLIRMLRQGKKTSI